jgi:hypothetical protein
MESCQLRPVGSIRDDRVDILGVGVSPINLGDAIAIYGALAFGVGRRYRGVKKDYH